MDVAAQLAIEAMLVGMAEAKVITYEQLDTILRSMDDAAGSAGRNMPAVDDAIQVLIANVRHLTGCHPQPGLDRR